MGLHAFRCQLAHGMWRRWAFVIRQRAADATVSLLETVCGIAVRSMKIKAGQHIHMQT